MASSRHGMMHNEPASSRSIIITEQVADGGNQAITPPSAVKIHEATRAVDASGAVIKGAPIDLAAAVARRKAGLDVVVCGQDLMMNRQTALEIEQAVGPWLRQQSHTHSAGPHSLPHFSNVSRHRSDIAFTRPLKRKPENELLHAGTLCSTSVR